MGKKTQAGVHGVELVEKVIAHLDAEGFDSLGAGEPEPVPAAVLETLTFPGGQPLSPAVRRWLAYDASVLEWFRDAQKPVFEAQKLGELAQGVYGMDWGYGDLEVAIGGDCFLVPFGSDSCRFLYVGQTDSAGEYPVLLLDTDDVPYIGVEYPGLDVYLAVHSDLIEGADVYGGLIEDPVYGARMKEHADRLFGGREGVDMSEWDVIIGEDYGDDADFEDDEDGGDEA